MHARALVVALPLMALLLTGCGAATEVADTTAELPDVRGPWAEHRDVPRVQVPLGDAPQRGAARPLVTLVVFSDFECRYCRMFEPALARVVREHPDDVRLVFRHLPLPFHEHAGDAAEATEEARAQRGDEAFWALHDRLFADGGGLAPRDLAAHAEAIGLDAERFRIALRTHAHGDRIEDDLDLADRVGADGTPATYVNGRPLIGALPYEELSAIVDEELALARDALHRGIPRGAMYAAVMRESLERAPAPPPREAPPERARRSLDRDVVYALPADGAPQLGPSDAPVTIVVFSDFQCPFCARALTPLAALRERYPDRLRLVFRNNPLPFHRDAAPAAAAALEAFAQRGDAGFWAMHDLLFENQRALDRASLERYAGQLGLDLARFSTALDGGAHDAAIARDLALAERLGARGTPIFYVNGRIVQGAQPLPVFVGAVEDALERAEAERARGTPAADVYRALMREASPDAVWQGLEAQEQP
jgi:protein-disulfide isomerase